MPTEQQKFSAAVDTYATTRVAATLICKARKIVSGEFPLTAEVGKSPVLLLQHIHNLRWVPAGRQESHYFRHLLELSEAKYYLWWWTSTERSGRCCLSLHIQRRWVELGMKMGSFKWNEGSATKEISYTSWRNQLKSSWSHEKSKQTSLKSSLEISPTL